MKITIITDNVNSWFITYGHLLADRFKDEGHDVVFIHDKKEILKGDICFILSCSRIIEETYLKLNKNNIVVHESDLPKGKGFAPLQWQILEGKNEIVVTLFEAVKEVDAGPYYLKSKLKLNGTELYPELRKKLADTISDISCEYLKNQKKLIPIPQEGEESFYQKRKIQDDKLDINMTIKEQFNHFRIADNERYPLYFFHKNKKYILKIYTEE